MAAKEILAGKAVVEVGTRLAIQRGLKAAEDHFRNFGAKVNRIGVGVAAAGAVAIAGAAAAFAPLLASAKQFADVGSELDDMAQRTGAAVEGLSALGYAARQSGSSLAAVEGGMKKAQKAIVDAANGSKELSAAFGSLGLDVDRLLQMTPDAQFKAIAAAVGAIENPTQRAAMAMQIFGKSGTELLPLMRSNIKELTDEAAKLGLVMSGESAGAAAALGDAIDRASDVIQGAFLQIGAALAPVLTGLLGRVVDVVAGLSGWIRANQKIVVVLAGLTAAVAAAGAALVALGGAAVMASTVFSAMATICAGASAVVGFFATATAGATTITAAFGMVLNAALAPLYAILSPLALAAVAVVALGAAMAAAVAVIAYQAGLVGDAFAWLGSKFWDLLSTVQTTLGGVAAAISSGQYALAAQILWAGVKLAFWQGADAALEAVAGLFNNSLSIVNRFNAALAGLVYRGFAALPSIMQAALTGGSITAILQTLVLDGFDVGGVLDGQVAAAQGELAALTAKIQAEKQAEPAPPTQRGRPQAGIPSGTGGGPAVASALPAIANAEADTLASLRAARARHASTSYASGNAFNAAENELQQRERAFMAKQATAAAKARAELQDASAAKATLPSGTRTPEARQLGEAMATTRREMKTSTASTFTAAAAGLLGVGGSDDRVANNTATQVSLMRRMLKQRQRGASYS